MSLEGPTDGTDLLEDGSSFDSPPPTTQEPKIITKRELALSWAKTATGVTVAAVTGVGAKMILENLLAKSEANTTIAELEKASRLQLFLNDRQFIPSDWEKNNIIKPAKQEIASVASSLKISPEEVCFDPLLLKRSVTLSGSCNIVDMTDGIEANYQRYLGQTNHAEWVNYRNQLGFAEGVPMVFLAAVAIVAAAGTLKSAKVSIGKSASFLKQQLTNGRLHFGSFLRFNNPS